MSEVKEMKLDDGRLQLRAVGPSEAGNTIRLNEAGLERYPAAFASFTGGHSTVSHQWDSARECWVSTMTVTIPDDDGRSEAERVAETLLPGRRAE